MSSLFPVRDHLTRAEQALDAAHKHTSNSDAAQIAQAEAQIAIAHLLAQLLDALQTIATTMRQ